MVVKTGNRFINIKRGSNLLEIIGGSAFLNYGCTDDITNPSLDI